MTKNKMTYSGGHQSLQFGRRQIQYELTYSDRKQLTINVHPDLRVTVKVPLGRAPGEVAQRVQRRAPWIAKQLDHFERFHPLPTQRHYVSGETHIYLGRQYLLKVTKSRRSEVKLVGRHLRVCTPFKDDREYNGLLVQGWYDDHAKNILGRRLSICMETAKKAGLRMPITKYRHMKRRWGSCAKSGLVTLNLELVRAPIHCIDYVIMHELCHLLHKNHSPGFWRLLSRLMPDWEGRRKRLEEVLV